MFKNKCLKTRNPVMCSCTGEYILSMCSRDLNEIMICTALSIHVQNTHHELNTYFQNKWLYCTLHACPKYSPWTNGKDEPYSKLISPLFQNKWLCKSLILKIYVKFMVSILTWIGICSTGLTVSFRSLGNLYVLLLYF